MIKSRYFIIFYSLSFRICKLLLGVCHFSSLSAFWGFVLEIIRGGHTRIKRSAKNGGKKGQRGGIL